MTVVDRLEREIAGHRPGARDQQLVLLEQGRGSRPAGRGGLEVVHRERHRLGLVLRRRSGARSGGCRGSARCPATGCGAAPRPGPASGAPARAPSRGGAGSRCSSAPGRGRANRGRRCTRPDVPRGGPACSPGRPGGPGGRTGKRVCRRRRSARWSGSPATSPAVSRRLTSGRSGCHSREITLSSQAGSPATSSSGPGASVPKTPPSTRKT